MFAAFGSRSAVSQPVSTTGENAMTSTRWAMKPRSALIWFSCFCCASEKRRSMPASFAALWMDSVLAVRHSLSAPIWLKPGRKALGAAFPAPSAGPLPPLHAATTNAAASASVKFLNDDMLPLRTLHLLQGVDSADVEPA